MGTTCDCLILLCSLSFSDCLDLLGIIVNASLAVWIVKTIQNRLTNKRILKDHFINEVKEIRNEYRNFLSNLQSNKISAKSIIPWFKLMNIKVNDLLNTLYNKYNVDMYVLRPYQIELQQLITDNTEFIGQFNSTSPLSFSDHSLIQFIRFQQNHNHIFNDIIVEINDAI